MTYQRMDSPQIPHRDAELLLYLHLRRAGPMEAIPVESLRSDRWLEGYHMFSNSAVDAPATYGKIRCLPRFVWLTK